MCFAWHRFSSSSSPHLQCCTVSPNSVFLVKGSSVPSVGKCWDPHSFVFWKGPLFIWRINAGTPPPPSFLSFERPLVPLASKHWDPHPFFGVVCHVCLPFRLGKYFYFFLFWLTSHLHIRADSPGCKPVPVLCSRMSSLIWRHHVRIWLWSKEPQKFLTNH